MTGHFPARIRRAGGAQPIGLGGSAGVRAVEAAERAQLIRQDPPLVGRGPVVRIERAVGAEPVYERDQPPGHDFGLGAGYLAIVLSQQRLDPVKRARVWELTPDDWNWVLGVDFWSVVYGVRAFVPRMLEQGEGGHIVNTSSMAGLLPMPNLGAYAAAKSAVLALSLSLQTELDQLGSALGVSVLCPGFIATGITNSARNRPAGLADEAPPPDVPRTTAGVAATLTAADVAEQVVEAITSNRFWILTHDQYRPVIMQHAAGVGTAARPAPAPIW